MAVEFSPLGHQILEGRTDMCLFVFTTLEVYNQRICVQLIIQFLFSFSSSMMCNEVRLMSDK
jgi:hypothetical protein